MTAVATSKSAISVYMLTLRAVRFMAAVTSLDFLFLIIAQIYAKENVQIQQFANSCGRERQRFM